MEYGDGEVKEYSCTGVKKVLRSGGQKEEVMCQPKGDVFPKLTRRHNGFIHVEILLFL